MTIKIWVLVLLALVLLVIGYFIGKSMKAKTEVTVMASGTAEKLGVAVASPGINPKATKLASVAGGQA